MTGMNDDSKTLDQFDRQVFIPITAYVKRRVLGCDYANNIAVIARKALGPASGL